MSMWQCACVGVALAAAGASGAIYQMEAAGTIETIDHAFSGPYNTIITPGASWTMTVQYDSSAPITSTVLPGFVNYETAILSYELSVDGQMVIQNTAGKIGVSDGVLGDAYLFDGHRPDDELSSILSVSDLSGSAFTGVALPQQLDLTDFPDSEITIFTSSGDIGAHGSVSSLTLTVVPAPWSAAVLGGVGFLARRRRSA